MKTSKFTEAQIAFALKQAELGTKVDEVCRKLGVSEATFYNSKMKYGGLGPSELRRLRQLEEENTKLKRLVADLSLDKTCYRTSWQKSSEAFAQAGILALSERRLIARAQTAKAEKVGTATPSQAK